MRVPGPTQTNGNLKAHGANMLQPEFSSLMNVEQEMGTGAKLHKGSLIMTKTSSNTKNHWHCLEALFQFLEQIPSSPP